MVSSHFYYFGNRSLFLTKKTYKYYYTYAGADITSCTKNGDTPMYLAVYRVTKQLQAFDPVCINILYNAGTVTLYQFQQKSCIFIEAIPLCDNISISYIPDLHNNLH
jgi:hypothetical protein